MYIHRTVGQYSTGQNTQTSKQEGVQSQSTDDEQTSTVQSVPLLGKPPSGPSPGASSSSTSADSTVSTIESLIAQLPPSLQGQYSSSLITAQTAGGSNLSSTLSALQSSILTKLQQVQGNGTAPGLRMNIVA